VWEASKTHGRGDSKEDWNTFHPPLSCGKQAKHMAEVIQRKIGNTFHPSLSCGKHANHTVEVKGGTRAVKTTPYVMIKKGQFGLNKHINNPPL